MPGRVVEGCAPVVLGRIQDPAAIPAVMPLGLGMNTLVFRNVPV
jgi:hypothetical protein